MLWLITVLCVVSGHAAFKVTVPAGRVVVVQGQAAVLGCEFTPDTNTDLSSLVVTWQRKEDSRVVHSFYYQQDQLERQSAAYRNRTALFVTELKNGNASLRIEAVGPGDEGEYMCMVSNTKGTDKAEVQLECEAFQVTVPADRLVAVRGQVAVLGCEFTPDTYPDLSSLVVTWQRKEDSRVVHSFYYQQDQLERQSAAYRNRTALFVTELKNGNASLRIEAVGPGDEGEYMCMVSNTKGTDKAQVQLEYGALYTEPRLSISFSCSNVMVRYEAEGFPKPEVQWLGDQGQNLTHQTELTEGPNGTEGLYYLKSSFVADSSAFNVTFTLMNHLLNQHLQRPVNLTHGGDHVRCGESSVVIILSVLCFLLFLSMMFLLFMLRRTKAVPTHSGTYQPANQTICLDINGG